MIGSAQQLDMEAYDRLPPRLRRVLRHTVPKIEARSALAALDQGVPVETIEDFILALDKRYVRETPWTV